jgi:hypothetical protein
MKLSEIILNEEPGPRQATVKLSKLTFDLLVSMFGQPPFRLPNPDDTSSMAYTETQLGYWTSAIEKRYGDVNIRIDTEAGYWEKVKVLDDKFISDKNRYTAGKAAWLDKERSAGRTSGLD